MNKNNYIFSLENVSFKFSKESPYFFQNISLTLEPGMHYFVCGKNGVGKSTFFRIMQADFQTDEYCVGKIRIADLYLDIERDKSYGKYVRLLQQDVDSMLADMLTVQENLQCALLPRYPGLQGLSEVIGSELLSSCGIKPDQQVGSLSGGQRQMLAIIMALQKPAHVLLLDEPTAALDTENAVKVLDFLKDVAQKRNLVVIIISHNTELMAKYVHNETYIAIEEKEGLRQIRYITREG